MITEKYYSNIDETLYSEVFENGLTAYYLPKAKSAKTYGIFSTSFGSLDISFAGQTYPAGIAHFLEHKLFEKAEGDVMLKFGSLGAQTNAFTSFDRTAYLFVGSENTQANIELLVDFVQQPYFTEASVAKEQGIITQEIQMYQDDADWRLYAGLLAALYPDSPLAEDIAGTPESIGQITAEMLYQNYQAFYQPSNMSLFLTGPFEVSEISQLLRENQAKKRLATPKIDRAELTFLPARSFSETSMEISETKLGFGLRGNNSVAAETYLEYQLAMRIFFAMIFGKTSKFYENAYSNGLIDDSFNYEFEHAVRFQCFMASLDTKEPEKLAKILQDELKKYKINADTSEAKFELLRRQMIGAHIASLNSQEHVANEFVAMSEWGGKTFFDSSELLSKLTLEKVLNFAEIFLENSESSIFIIRPK